MVIGNHFARSCRHCWSKVPRVSTSGVLDAIMLLLLRIDSNSCELRGRGVYESDVHHTASLSLFSLSFLVQSFSPCSASFYLFNVSIPIQYLSPYTSSLPPCNVSLSLCPVSLSLFSVSSCSVSLSLFSVSLPMQRLYPYSCSVSFPIQRL